MSQGSEKRARSQHLTIRLTDEERAAIHTAARSAGLTPGSYARQTMLGDALPRQMQHVPVERRELARLLGELGRIGNNLNQVARGVNTGVVTGEGQIAELRANILQMRNAVLKALGREP